MIFGFNCHTLTFVMMAFFFILLRTLFIVLHRNIVKPLWIKFPFKNFPLIFLCRELHKTSLPPPSCVTSDPTLILLFSPFANFFFLEEAIPGCFSMENPHSTPLSQASSSGPRSLYQLFVRDLPPQSHKSTEDRCLLWLIKALPPGVIPQFEQEEKPSEGGNVLDQSYEGPILYTHI